MSVLDEKETFFFHNNKTASKHMRQQYRAYNKTVVLIKVALQKSKVKRNRNLSDAQSIS